MLICTCEWPYGSIELEATDSMGRTVTLNNNVLTGPLRPNIAVMGTARATKVRSKRIRARVSGQHTWFPLQARKLGARCLERALCVTDGANSVEKEREDDSRKGNSPYEQVSSAPEDLGIMNISLERLTYSYGPLHLLQLLFVHGGS